MIISDTTTQFEGTGDGCASPTTTTADIYAPPTSNGIYKARTKETVEAATGNMDQNGSEQEAYSIEGQSSPSRGPLLFRFLRFLFFNGPLLACWILLLASFLVQEIWDGPLERLLKSFYIRQEYSGELYKDLNHELTYYHRRCDHRDISTHDANDLLIDNAMSTKERQEIVLTHGAVVMKDILSPSTAAELRRYLETRHHEFHNGGLKLPWDELFWDGDGGNRLSLGLGPEDAPIISRAISEVGSNLQLKKTLEATLGKDPAVVEVSTLSTMHNADPQGIHTDSDYFGSSVLYTRSFLHSYTMFISLQNTTSRMGATTICPGTHWCADEDLEKLCQCNYFDDDKYERYPIKYCNTFEASSNGKTGLDVGVLQQGDAMMFNQNIWHRGPRNYDEQRKENRAMFIMTFVTRRDFEKGDNRQQGWGTYYYMRHSMWGHLFSDLKTAASGGMDLFKRRIWKAYGLIGASKRGNLPWLEHWARQMSNNMDFFAKFELEDCHTMLTGLASKNRLLDWLFPKDDDIEEIFDEIDVNEDYATAWKDYLDLWVESALHQSKEVYFTVAMATALANGVAWILYCVFLFIQKWREGGQHYSGALSQAGWDASRRIKNALMGHLMVVVIIAGLRYYILHRAPLFERINSNDINFKAFPPLSNGMADKHEDTKTFIEYVEPVDVLISKQEHEEKEFEMEHPRHPYSAYYQEEYNRLQHSRKTFGYSAAKPDSRITPQSPTQSSAYPERNDVLIGSRFDADFLASMNFVLDFHPGTKEWIRLMKEHQRSISQNLDESYLSMVVDTIVTKILDTNDGFSPSLLSNEEGTPRRFLKQDYETGWWVAMTQIEAKAITRRALLALANPISVGVSYDHWKQVLAESRFGKRRDTALARKWIPQLVDKMTSDLFVDKIGIKDNEISLIPMASAEMKKKLAPNEQGRVLFPSTGRGLLPKSIVTGKTSLSPSNVSLLRHTVIPFRVQLRNHMKGVTTLKLGDLVLFKGEDDQDLIFQATIVYIDAEHNMLELQPLRFDEIHEEFPRFDEINEEYEDPTWRAPLEHVQFYRPAREGDIVWALTEDPDEEDESWKTYEILFLTPFGQAEMAMTPESLEKYDDDDFDDIPIKRDFKRLLLRDDRIPEIRLRQY